MRYPRWAALYLVPIAISLVATPGRDVKGWYAGLIIYSALWLCLTAYLARKRWLRR